MHLTFSDLIVVRKRWLRAILRTTSCKHLVLWALSSTLDSNYPCLALTVRAYFISLLITRLKNQFFPRLKGGLYEIKCLCVCLSVCDRSKIKKTSMVNQIFSLSSSLPIRFFRAGSSANQVLSISPSHPIRFFETEIPANKMTDPHFITVEKLLFSFLLLDLLLVPSRC
jgi:hypothetical protein